MDKRSSWSGRLRARTLGTVAFDLVAPAVMGGSDSDRRTNVDAPLKSPIPLGQRFQVRERTTALVPMLLSTRCCATGLLHVVRGGDVATRREDHPLTGAGHSTWPCARQTSNEGRRP